MNSAAFRPTRWSLIVQAGSSDAAAAREAMQQLCEAYWYPVYAAVRQRGAGPEDAEDTVQSFFAQLIGRDAFAGVDREKGRLRSWLLGALDRHLADEARTRSAVKRGGDLVRVPWHEAEPRYLEERADHETPETIYHRRWALAVLAQAMSDLEHEWHEKGEAAAFALLKPALTTPTAQAIDTAAVASTLGIPREHVKVRVHRLRTALRESVLRVVAETMPAATRSEVEEEMRDLMTALG